MHKLLFRILFLACLSQTALAAAPLCEKALKEEREALVLAKFKNTDFVQQCGGTCYFETFRELVESILRYEKLLAPNEEVSRSALFLNYAQEFVDHIFLKDNIRFAKILLKKRKLYSEKDGRIKGLFDGGGTSNTDVIMLSINIPVAARKDPKITDLELAHIQKVLYEKFKKISDIYGEDSRRFIGDERIHKSLTDSINKLKSSISTQRSYFLEGLERTPSRQYVASTNQPSFFDSLSEKHIRSHIDAGLKLDMFLHHEKEIEHLQLRDGKIKYYDKNAIPKLDTTSENHSASIMGYTTVRLEGESNERIDYLIAKQSWSRENGIFLVDPAFVESYARFRGLDYNKIILVPTNTGPQ